MSSASLFEFFNEIKLAFHVKDTSIGINQVLIQNSTLMGVSVRELRMFSISSSAVSSPCHAPKAS